MSHRSCRLLLGRVGVVKFFLLKLLKLISSQSVKVEKVLEKRLPLLMSARYQV